MIVIYQPQSHSQQNSSGWLAGILKDRMHGYVNKQGKVVIPPQFDLATDFSEGMAVVRSKDNRFGYVNKKGIAIQPQFNWAGRFS